MPPPWLSMRRYLRDQKVSPDDDWNYVHNMMYAIANLMEQGKLKEANALSDHLAAARGRLSRLALYLVGARPDGAHQPAAARGAARGRLGRRAGAAGPVQPGRGREDREPALSGCGTGRFRDGDEGAGSQ